MNNPNNNTSKVFNSREVPRNTRQGRQRDQLLTSLQSSLVRSLEQDASRNTTETHLQMITRILEEALEISDPARMRSQLESRAAGATSDRGNDSYGVEPQDPASEGFHE